MKIKNKPFPNFMYTSIYTYTALIHKQHSAEATKDKDKVLIHL
jgi:hypothetical protein